MKLNWGFGIAMVYIAFAVGMILFAVRASQQKNDLVTEHYYEEAVNYQARIDAGNNSTLYNSGLSVVYLKNENMIDVTVSGEHKSIAGTLSFYKPDKAEDDFKLDFKTDESGKQLIPLKTPASGLWKINGSWIVNGKNCSVDQKLFIPKP